MIKIIKYSKEHIHLIRLDRGDMEPDEQCFLSRNYNRCTASNITAKEFHKLPAGGSRKYFNGDKWEVAQFEKLGV